MASKANVVLIVNEYEHTPAGKKGATQDAYVLMESKRRVDEITRDEVNNGADINRLSEATVRALEKVHDVPKEKKGGVSKHLCDSIADVKADALNTAMGNSKKDNDNSGSSGENG